jgi:hypothetical protein
MNFLKLLLNKYDSQIKVSSASARQLVPQFDCPIYKAVITDKCSLFAGPNFTIVIIPAQEA